jgi:hypothetical protein
MKPIRCLGILGVCLLAIPFANQGEAALGQGAGCGPKCGGGVCAAPRLNALTKARQSFAAHFPNAPPAPEFKVVQSNVVVEVTGVAFFDFAHGQTGLAQNCIEPHPVLAFDFSTTGPFEAKDDAQAQPPKHPENWYSCIPRANGAT